MPYADPEVDTISALDTIEKASHGTLSTPVSLALAESQLAASDKALAAQRIARSWDLPLNYVFGYNATLGSYVDPITGGPMTLETARRLLAPHEADVIDYQLGSVLGPTTRIGQTTRIIDGVPKQVQTTMSVPEASSTVVSRLMAALAPLDGQSVSYAEALGAAVAMARAGVDPTLFGHNIAASVKLTGMGLSPLQVVSVAEHAASAGFQFRNEDDALHYLFPEASARIEALQGVNAAINSPHALAIQQASGAPEAVREAQLAQASAGEGSLPFGLPKIEAAGLAVYSLADRPQDYVTEAQRITSEMTMEKDAFGHSLLGKTLGVVGKGLNRALATVEFGIFETSAGVLKGIEAVGGKGLLQTSVKLDSGAIFHKNYDPAEHYYQQAHAIWAEQTNLGEALASNLGLPHWTGPLIELGTALAGTDPFLLAGKVSAGIKESRLLIDMSGEELLGRVVQGLDRGHVLLGRRTVPEYLVDLAKNSESDRAMYIRGSDRLRATFNVNRAIDPRVSDLIYNHVREFAALGRTDAELSSDVKSIFMHAFGAKEVTGDELQHLRDFISTADARKAAEHVAQRLGTTPEDVIAKQQIARKLAALEDPVNPNAARNVLDYLDGLPERQKAAWTEIRDAESSADAFAQVDKLPILFRREAPLMQEIPHVGITATVKDLWLAHVGEGPATDAIGRLFNKAPGTIVNFEKDPHLYMRQWLKRSASFDRTEIDTAVGKVIAANQPFNLQRERSLFSIFQSYEKQSTERIAKSLGFTPAEAKDILDRSVGVKMVQGQRELFGLLPTEGRLGGEGFEFFRSPLDTTQLVNELQLLDPIYVRQELEKTLTSITDMRQGILSAFQRGQGGTIAGITMKRLTREAGNALNKVFLRWWKPMVVLRPAYILRVPGGEEQLKFLADLGTMDRLASSQTARRLLPGSAFEGRTLEVTTDGVADLTRLGKVEPTADGIRLTLASPAHLPNIDEARLSRSVRDLYETTSEEQRRLLKSLKKSGNYDAITPDMPNHLNQWSRALNKQFGEGPIGRQVLTDVVEGRTAEQSIAGVKTLLTENPELMTRLNIDAASLDLRAEQSARYIRYLTTENRDVALSALAGQADEDTLKGLVEAGARPIVHGAQAAMAAGNESWLSKFGDGIGRWLFEEPHARLSHQPFTKVWYSKMMEQSLRVASENGTTITSDLLKSMDTEAKRFAVTQLRRVMLDFSIHSRLSELLSVVAPFFNPYEQMFVKWGRLFARNPALIGYIRLIDKAATDSGFVRQDPDTGEYIIPTSWFAAAGPTLNMMYGAGGNPLGKGFALSAPLAGLSMFFSDTYKIPGVGFLKAVEGLPLPAPGLSPPFLWFAQRLADSKVLPPSIRDGFAAWAFHYGPVTALDAMPSYLKHALEGFAGTSAIGKALGAESVLNSEAKDFLVLQQYQGHTPDPKLALAQAKALERYRGFLNAFSVDAPRISFPTQDIEDEWQKLVAKSGYDKARDIFLAKYPKLTLITIPKTYWSRGLDPKTGESTNPIPLPATEAAVRIMKLPGFQEFANEFPEWAWAIIPHEALTGKFDMGAYMDQLSKTWRTVRTPEQVLQADDIANGWDAATPLYEAWRAQKEAMRGKGLSAGDTSWKLAEETFTSGLAEVSRVYPEWGRLYGPDSLSLTLKGGVDPVVMAHARQLVTNETFLSFDVGKALAAYLDGRDQIAAELSRHNIGSIGSTAAETLGLTKQYDTMVADLEAKYPDFTTAYRTFFSKDLLKGIKTAGDRALAALSPAQRQEVTDFDIQRKQLLSQASVATDSAGQSDIYIKLAQLDERAFEGSFNPLKVWWATQGDADKASYKLSVATKPYEFLTRFDREVVLGEKTSAPAEQKWIALNQASQQVQSYIAQNPSVRLTGTKPLWDQVDAYARSLAKGDSVFTQQLLHSRQWGYAFTKVFPYYAEQDTAGDSWRSWIGAIQQFQSEADRLKLSGIHYGSSEEKALYGEGQLALQNYLQSLWTYSPQFKREWDKLDAQNGGKRLFDSFVTPDYFPIGGPIEAGP